MMLSSTGRRRNFHRRTLALICTLSFYSFTAHLCAHKGWTLMCRFCLEACSPGAVAVCVCVCVCVLRKTIPCSPVLSVQ